MAGGIDEVELVGLAVLRGVHHSDGVSLDGDAALAFEVHGIEHLGLHFARGEGSCELQQAVGERGFAVVNVRDDREIADESGVHGEWLIIDSNRGSRVVALGACRLVSNNGVASEITCAFEKFRGVSSCRV